MLRMTSLAFLAIGLSGCMGGGGNAKPLPKTEAVTGTVTLDDKPLEGAFVTFIPSGTTAGIECSGRTDKEGVYRPKQTRGEDGVPAGTYKVAISRFLRNGQPVDPKDTGGAGGVLTESLPPKYSNPATTTLKAEVTSGGGEIDFKLTSK